MERQSLAGELASVSGSDSGILRVKARMWWSSGSGIAPARKTGAGGCRGRAPERRNPLSLFR